MAGMTTNGHENEVITVSGLKAALQKFKSIIVTSGFALTEDDANGLDKLAPIGSATITDDNEKGLDVLTF